MFKKFLALCVILAMAAQVACAGKAEPEGGSAETASEEIAEEITMVTNAEFPPFEFVTDEGLVGRFDGIDVAIANEIAKKAGKTLVIEDVPFESIIIELAQGMADFAIAGMTVDEERLESVDFSTPYFNATQYIIVTEDNADITSAADLTDKTVGVVDGYTGQQICMNDLELPNLESYKNPSGAVMALTQGKIDAVVLDSHTSIAFVKTNEGLKTIQDETFANEEYAIAVKKGDQETLDLVNGVIEQLIADGAIDEFVAKYTAEMEITE